MTPALAYSSPPQAWNWIAQLADQGWAIVHNLVPAELITKLTQEAARLHREDELERAGIGRTSDFQIEPSVRRDKTRWFDRSSEAQSRYLNLMDDVRLEVNRQLFLGLFSYEAHFAAYEPGGFYKRHLDAFKGARNRVLSTVFYLNEDWQEAHGGELAIFSDDREDALIAKVPPEAGTMVIFLSEDIPHEVLPTNRTRYSIAGWFRVNDRIVAPGLQAPSGIVSEF